MIILVVLETKVHWVRPSIPNVHVLLSNPDGMASNLMERDPQTVVPDVKGTVGVYGAGQTIYGQWTEVFHMSETKDTLRWNSQLMSWRRKPAGS